MQKKLPRLIVRPATVILCVTLTALEGSVLALVPFLASLFHELGHLALMFVLGVRVDEVELTVFGAEIRTLPMTVGCAAQVAVYASGAVANLLSSAVVLAAFGRTFGARFFAACSVSLALLNLLPIRTLDGGCVLETLLSRLAPIHSDTVFAAISGITLFVLWLGAAYLLLVCGGNLSLMLFCAYLFITLYMTAK